MAEEGIILPEEPLLIVERGWKRQPSRSTSSGQQTTRVDILRGPSPTPSRDASPGNASEPRRRGSQQRRDFQFVAATETDGRHDLAAQKLVRSHVRKQSLRRDTLHPSTVRRGSTPMISEAEASLTQPRQTSLVVDSPDPDSTTLCQGIGNTSTLSETSSLVGDRILVDIFCPLTRYIRFDPDPVHATWYQNISADTLLSQAMRLIASVFPTEGRSYETLRSTDSLMKSIHEQLITRIGQEHITDATIGSVMCLAFAEAQLGNGEKWAMHMNGLVNMLAVRGGVDTVDPMLRMELYTVDIHGSADRLDLPQLQRPFITPAVIEISQSTTDSIPALAQLSGKINSALRMALAKIFAITIMLSNAIDTQSSLNLETWSETCISTHYDIFESPALSNLDYIYRYVMILYMKTLCRTNPFTMTASLKTVTQLKMHLTALDISADGPLALWALAIASLASLDTGDRDWFLRIMGQSMIAADCRTWEDLKEQFMEAPWVSAVHNVYGIQLWHAIQAVQTTDL